MIKMIVANDKQIPVFRLTVSPNMVYDITVNTTIPIPNPMTLEGQVCPSKAGTRY